MKREGGSEDALHEVVLLAAQGRVVVGPVV
jgi:hypothetical protein